MMFKKIKKMFGVTSISDEEISHQLLKAEQGDVSAQYNIGTMYDAGAGLPFDAVKAIEWYKKAALQGHAKAQYALGMMYEFGYGSPHDQMEAEEWFKKSAGQGDTDALFHLNSVYKICADDLKSEK
ncbi:tetratricopeptide repeat protein [Morganella morganii]|uniref:tetratricopeptide repeat protein n=1 Tax=Morganella morganii TaxID=582 RepID=UPI00339C5EC6